MAEPLFLRGFLTNKILPITEWMRRAPSAQQVQSDTHVRSGRVSEVMAALLSEDGECAVANAKENGHARSSAVVPTELAKPRRYAQSGELDQQRSFGGVRYVCLRKAYLQERPRSTTLTCMSPGNVAVLQH